MRLASYATHNAGLAHFLRAPCIKNSHREKAMTTSLKLKLIGLATTVALFALPIAEAAAHYSHYS